jgi:REP element-mobilizing transposase RayT
MPRHPRLFVPGATYHVYCRVARGEFVFDDPFEAEEFVEAAWREFDLDGVRVMAWCLMGNHYHLVIQTGTTPLWRSMLRVQAAVARGFNRRRGFLGRLWQSRYRARVIDSTGYFRQVVSYVHLNPVAAGIVDDPVQYPNSGHREIVGFRPPRFVDLPSVLAGFEGGSLADARESYGAWVRAVAEAKWLDKGIGELPWWRMARDQDEVVPPGGDLNAETFDGHPFDEVPPTFTAAEFLRLFEESSGHDREDLSSPLRTRHLVEGRTELTLLAVSRFGVPSCDIADLIQKHPSSMTRWLNQGLRRERTDAVFRERIDHLDRLISSAARNKESLQRVAP